MSVTFTFHTVAERKPAHGQSIIFLQKRGGFVESFEPRHVEVEYVWEDGDGTSCGYDGEDSVEGYVLKILFDCSQAQDNDLWMHVDEYWAALDKGGV